MRGGVRVPLIVRWTGHIATNQVSDRVTGFEDWLPTLLDMSGAAGVRPRGVDGISFAPTLLGKAQATRPFLYREFPAYDGWQSVRVGDWKAVRKNLNPRQRTARPNLKIELYNLKGDPSESKDVAVANPEVVARFERIMTGQHEPSALFPFRALDALR